MAGEKGQRCITSRTMVLSHQWSGGMVGKSADLKASNAMREIEDAMFLRHYQDCTGLSEQEIRQKLLPPTDVYLSPREAVRLNLFDRVIDALG